MAKERGGQPGNTNSSKENRVVSDELRKVLAQHRAKVRAGWEKIVEKAEKGDLNAMNAIADRSEGKAHQGVALEHSGKITLEVTTADRKL